MGEWFKTKIKKLAVSIKRGYCLLSLRRNRMKVIHMHNAAIRQRYKMVKTLNLVYKMMDRCTCTQRIKKEEEATHLNDLAISDFRLGTNTTTSGRTPTATLATENVASINTYNGHDLEIEQVDNEDHKYRHECDLLSNLRLEGELHCPVHGPFEGQRMKINPDLEIGVKVKQGHGDKKGFKEETSSDKGKIMRHMNICTACKRNQELAEILEISVVEMNETVHALQEYIVECTIKIAKYSPRRGL